MTYLPIPKIDNLGKPHITISKPNTETNNDIKTHLTT